MERTGAAKRIFISDCEGPITRNNIAAEMMAHFVPSGSRVFEVISKYDEALANLQKDRDYAAGNTHKLVLPFLMAYDVDNQVMEEFCASHLVLHLGSKTTLDHVRDISRAFIVSTTYEHYIRAFCKQTGFPLENTYCTKLNLEDIKINNKEKLKLKSFAWEIAGMPIIKIPSNATSLHDLTKKEHETVKQLDKIFWKEISGMHCKKIFSDVTIAAGNEKEQIVREITATFSAPMEDVMYVGDSRADAKALRLVRDGGGFAVSMNGNADAIRSAQVAVLSANGLAVPVLADIFLRLGKAEALNVVGNWDRDALWRSAAYPPILDLLFEAYPKTLPKAKIISEWNREQLIKESNEFRKAQNELATQPH